MAYLLVLSLVLVVAAAWAGVSYVRRREAAQAQVLARRNAVARLRYRNVR